MIHIETSVEYGASDHMLGRALEQIFASGQYDRSKVIVRAQLRAEKDPV